MAEIHRLLQAHGKAGVLALDLDRRVVEAAAGYLDSEEGEVGFLYSGWAQSALPHRMLANDLSWQVHTNHVSLVVQPGLRPCLTGEAVSVGVPYGSRARLIILYLQSEALKTQSREVELGKTLHAWLRRLEIPIGGKSMAAVKNQAERIFRCRMSFQIKRGNRTGLMNQSILDTAMFVEDDSAQGSLFIERAKLSEMFFDQLKKNPVPIEENAVAMISNNSMAIDVYCWLAYRLHSLTAPKPVSWNALHTQFGRGLARLDHFRWYFTQNVHLAMAVYPEAKVDVDTRGLILRPSRPPGASKIVSPRRVGKTVEGGGGRLAWRQRESYTPRLLHGQRIEAASSP
jgi:hypothetical protein